MPIKHADFIIQGMFRDTSEHTFDSKFAYENQNLRITAEPNSDSGHTGDMYALTNERGNKYTPIIGLENQDMDGIPIGQCTINNQWVVFYTSRPEKVELSDESLGVVIDEDTDLSLVSGDSDTIGLPDMMQDKEEEVEIKDYRGILPCDCAAINQVKDCKTGVCYRQCRTHSCQMTSHTDTIRKNLPSRHRGM